MKLGITTREEYEKKCEELGLKDWAYESNPSNPTWCDSKFGEFENGANLVWED